MQSPEKEKSVLLGKTMRSTEIESSTIMKSSPRLRSASTLSVLSKIREDVDYNYRESLTGPLRIHGQTSLSGMSGPLCYMRNREVIFEPPQFALEQKALVPKLETGIHNSDEASESYEVTNEHLMRSGHLGKCDDPYCTVCPTIFHDKQPTKHSRTADLDPKFHNLLNGDSEGFVKRIRSFIEPYIPGVINPHAKVIQRWNKLLVLSCLFAIFTDPLFFFLLLTQEKHKCLVLDWTLTKTLVAFRSLNDFIYFLHIMLQFRLAYIAPDSKVVGAGTFVDDPRKIAHKYMTGYFLLDLFVVLPLPQIIIFFLPYSNDATGAIYAKNLLRTCILVQYIPRLYRFFPMLAGQSPTGFIFESAWSNFIINLLMFVLAGHVVGSCWYLFAVQRIQECLREACRNCNITRCVEFLDCGHGHISEFEKEPTWNNWQKNTNTTACFIEGGNFSYGIYKSGIALTTTPSFITRYIFSLFWGFQQISTLAGNQEPSYYEGEVLFVMLIIGIGLMLFALLIGNMQNFLQSLGKRRLEMTLRHRDVEQWMRHRRLPENLQRQVREAERFYWAATHGVKEEMLMENLPEDLQRDIRRHLFKFLKRVRIFRLLDDPILDVICERLRTTTFIKGGIIFFPGGLFDKMVFIIRGEMESIAEDRFAVQLSTGGVCGEELLGWYLEHSSPVNTDRKRIGNWGRGLVSNRLVRCLTNVEAFVLRAGDLEDITSLFSRFFKSPRVQGAIRYDSPYWQGLAVRRIQVAWRHRMKQRSRGE